MNLHPCYRVDEHSSHNWWEPGQRRWQRCPGHTTLTTHDLEDLTGMRKRTRLHIRDATLATTALALLILYVLWPSVGYAARVVLIVLAAFSVWATVRP